MCIFLTWRAKPCTVWGGQAEGSGGPLLKGDETGGLLLLTQLEAQRTAERD